MNGIKLIGKELQRICSEKALLIPLIVILFVPLMYGGMFLWAFKDPYGKMDQLPVAVVNQDKGAEMEGESLQLGKELTEKIIESEAFHFQVVPEKEAMEGLEDLTYYMVIKIPEDFSENATTLLEDEPKKLELEYIPNDSYNFLASQIGETVVSKVQYAMSQEISKTYAETVFSKITEMADGFKETEKGTGKLNDGAISLKDGGKEIKENLQILASKSIEFKNGMESAKSGSEALAAGSAQLSDGFGQLNAAGGQLLDGTKQIGEGANTLSNKMKEASDGAQQINYNLPKLVAGTEEIQNGLSALQAALPQQLAKEITEKSEGLISGINQINEAIDFSLTNELAPQLTEGLSKSVANEMADVMATNQQQQISQLTQLLKTYGVDDETTGKIIQTLAENSPSKEELQENLYQSLKPSFQNGIDGAIQKTVQNIDGGFDKFEKDASKQLTASNLEKQISEAIDPVMNQLQAGLVDVNNGQKALQSGVNQLADGMKQLSAGALQLNNGGNELVSNMGIFVNKLSEAASGANELSNGANKLSSGLDKLLAGSIQFSDGSQKLANGATQLSDGMNELQKGMDKLHSKMKEAADKTGSIQADDQTYDMMASPVDLKTTHMNEVSNYGTGFAPYFISLGLFVGALILTIIFPIVIPAGKPRGGLSWFVSKFGIMASIGIIQSIIVDFLVLYVLHIEVQSVPLFFLFTVITSLSFMALIQALVTWGDNVGRFLCIILLILQLTSCAGTFPLEVIPDAIQWFNPILPMTYTVFGFKAVISSGDYGFMWYNAGILMLFVLGSAILSYIYFHMKFKKKYKNELMNDEPSDNMEYAKI